MRYGLEDKPPVGHFLLYGLQWWAVSLPTAIIIGLVVARLHFDDLPRQIHYLQKVFFVMGLTGVVQVLFGHRLPVIEGPASILLVGMLAARSAGTDAIYTAILTGGAVMAAAAATGLLARMRPWFTPRIISIILILIALTLSPTILNMTLSGGPALFNLFFVLLLTIAMVAANNLLRGVWKSLTVLLGLIGGSLVHILCNGVAPAATAGGTAKAAAGSLFLERLDFQPAVVVAFLFCFLALSVNQLGSIESLGYMLRADGMDARVRRGQTLGGVLNMLAGGLGVVGPVSFSFSAGVVAATGCAARLTLVPAGAALAACGLFPRIMFVFSQIPGPVMAAMMLYLMSTQFASGLAMMAKDKCVDDFAGGLMASLPLMTGLVISFLPAAALADCPAFLRPLVGNGFVMGIAMALVLEHAVFRRKNQEPAK